MPRKRVGETLKSLHPCLFDPMPLQDTLRQSVSFLYLENHSLGEWFIGRLLSIMKTEKLPLLYNRSAVWQLHKIKQWEVIKMNDVNSLSHTRWNCKYHIVFAPKYRRKVFYGQKRKEIRLRERGRTGAEVFEADGTPCRLYRPYTRHSQRVYQPD